MTDYYSILEIKPPSSAQEIKKSYYGLAMKHHPDKGGDQQKFKEISEAYQVLSDPEKKKNYDRFGTIPDQTNLKSSWDIFQQVATTMFDQWEYAGEAKKLWKLFQNNGGDRERSGGENSSDSGEEDSGIREMLSYVKSKMPSGQDISGLVQEYHQFYQEKNFDTTKNHATDGFKDDTPHTSQENQCSQSYNKECPEICLRIKISDIMTGVIKKLELAKGNSDQASGVKETYYIPSHVSKMNIDKVRFSIQPVWNNPSHKGGKAYFVDKYIKKKIISVNPEWTDKVAMDDLLIELPISLTQFYTRSNITLDFGENISRNILLPAITEKPTLRDYWKCLDRMGPPVFDHVKETQKHHLWINLIVELPAVDSPSSFAWMSFLEGKK